MNLLYEYRATSRSLWILWLLNVLDLFLLSTMKLKTVFQTLTMFDVLEKCFSTLNNDFSITKVFHLIAHQWWMIQNFGSKFILVTSEASENKIYKETWDFYHFYLCEKTYTHLEMNESTSLMNAFVVRKVVEDMH